MKIKALKNLGRLRDIAMVLLKYGFEDLVQRLELTDIGPFKHLSAVDHSLNTFQRIRHAMEELGPTFVKFGQVMSLRPDLLPVPLIEELSKLQDEVAAIDFEEIRSVVEESLGKKLEDVFSVFDRAPLAAASLSQVHRAVLRKEGHIVSVKVQRPNIHEKIDTDLDVLEYIAAQVHDRLDELQIYDLPELVRVIHKTLLREIDFRKEARHIAIARGYNPPDSGIHIPEVYESYSTEHLLVLEFVQGTKLKNLQSELLSDAESLAKTGLGAAVRQILDDGFFHADPHPGNLLLTADEKLCLLDWGMIGILTETDRYELVDLINAVVTKDSHGLMEVVLQITSAAGLVERRSLERDLMTILISYHSRPLREWELGRLLLDVTALLREYRLRMPSDLVIMIKALVTAEGTARLICPELDVISESKAYVKKLISARYRPQKIQQNVRSSLAQFFSMQQTLPRRILQILEKIEHGSLNIRSEHHNLEGLRDTLENVSNRLTIGIITAAIIIGSSMIITTGIGPHWFGFSALGVIGYLASALFGIWIIINIFRSRRY